MMEKIERTMHGNGKQGICDIVKDHEVTIRNIKYGIGLGFTILTMVILIANFFN